MPLTNHLSDTTGGEGTYQKGGVRCESLGFVSWQRTEGFLYRSRLRNF